MPESQPATNERNTPSSEPLKKRLEEGLITLRKQLMALLAKENPTEIDLEQFDELSRSGDNSEDLDTIEKAHEMQLLLGRIKGLN